MTTRNRPWSKSVGSRHLSSLALDGAVVFAAWQLTHLFRLGFERWISARAAYDFWVSMGVVLAYLTVIAVADRSRGLWRYTSFVDIKRLTVACVITGSVVALVVSPLMQWSKIPRAVLVLHPFISLMGLCLVRLMSRAMAEEKRARHYRRLGSSKSALVLGAGEASRRLIAGIQGHGWEILGLLDDDPEKVGTHVCGINVLGTLGDLEELAAKIGPTHLVIALPSIRGARRKAIIEHASKTGLPILTIPSATELQEGQGITSVRDVNPEDVLGREPVRLDESSLAEVLRGASVLVTGAGGSIGSELCLQLARFKPSTLILVDHAEHALYRIEQRIRELHPDLTIRVRLGDVKDAVSMKSLMLQFRPQLVLHAAAYKHVPLVEEGNEWAAIHNNAVGTWVTARAAAECGIDRFVLISTDKAVNPTNVMGATKRAAERLMGALVAQYPRTRFIAVRFGNVLGSSGSVIPKFKEQIARGGPVTVTHPEVIRYFMTIPEACRLVLQAGAVGGDSGQVLVLDMGDPIRISDLARAMIRLSGHTEDEIPILYTGLRPGEKLYEELIYDEEQTLPTDLPCVRLSKLRNDYPFEDALRWIDKCSNLPRDVEAPTDQASEVEDLSHLIRRHLMHIVPEYAPRM